MVFQVFLLHFAKASTCDRFAMAHGATEAAEVSKSHLVLGVENRRNVTGCYRTSIHKRCEQLRECGRFGWASQHAWQVSKCES